MSVQHETLTTPLREATTYPAVDLLANVDPQSIEKNLGSNQTARDIWDAARPLLDGGPRAQRFWEVVPITPLLKIPDEALPRDIQGNGHDIYLLADGQMPSGAYKLGGVMNALLSELERNSNLSEVHVASTGNHAAATALASMLLGLECTTYMPNNAVWAKVENAEQYGARIRFLSSLQRAVKVAEQAGARPDALFIHPYDQLSVIAGQGSATVRLQRQLEVYDIDPANVEVTYPLGGGGNAAGNAVVGAVMLPDMRTNVAYAEGFDPAVDGAAVRERGKYGNEILGLPQFVQQVQSVELGTIGEAMAVTARVTDLYEPAGALALAAVFEDVRNRPERNSVRVAHGSGINTTLGKVSEFARYAYASDRLSGEEAHQLISRAGVDSRRRNELEERAWKLAAAKAGTVSVRARCRVISSPTSS